MPWLSREYPDLVPRYQELYPRAYASAGARKELGSRVSSIVRAMGGLDPGGPAGRPSRSATSARLRRPATPGRNSCVWSDRHRLRCLRR